MNMKTDSLSPMDGQASLHSDDCFGNWPLVNCVECKHAKVSATEVNCLHWHHPGRSMARDLRYERSAMLHVIGMEWAQRCVNFKANVKPTHE